MSRIARLSTLSLVTAAQLDRRCRRAAESTQAGRRLRPQDVADHRSSGACPPHAVRQRGAAAHGGQRNGAQFLVRLSRAAAAAGRASAQPKLTIDRRRPRHGRRDGRSRGGRQAPVAGGGALDLWSYLGGRVPVTRHRHAAHRRRAAAGSSCSRPTSPAFRCRARCCRKLVAYYSRTRRAPRRRPPRRAVRAAGQHPADRSGQRPGRRRSVDNAPLPTRLAP